jgi:hypothetical protein
MHPARQGNQPVVVAVVCIHRIARARPGRAGACHEAPIHAADGKAVKEETLCLPVKPATAGRQQASVLCPAPSFFFPDAQRFVGSQSRNRPTGHGLWAASTLVPAQSVREPSGLRAWALTVVCSLPRGNQLAVLRVVLPHLTLFIVTSRR